MGRIEKKLSDTTVKYYWYPGEKREWVRAAVALGVGAAVAALLMLVTRNSVAAVVTGTSVTLAMAGFNLGRRDGKALSGFPGMGDKAARRASIGHSGKAAWRGLVMGVGSALAAVLIINLSPTGWFYDWVLPVVPAVVSAVARQFGLLWDKLGTSVSTKGPASVPAPAQPEGGA
ncbi:hypothetical protein [Hamadaea tsunoensis]|uniref:hypothetical protein n=1 Tax=Hamadaea tsunoensis TaxID=53368 RepID=UPI0004857578|nr:hypothetical protein [Hamadaea tsunoensis]